MRIVVCVKQIRHIYARSGRDPAHYFLTPIDAVFRVNPLDEEAMGMAARIKGNHEGTEILLLTLGPLIAEEELRRCAALGADDIYRIEEEGSLDPWGKAVLLSRAVRDLGPDLVLCGKESLDQQNGQVGTFLAHRLGFPFVTAVKDIKIPTSRDSVEVLRSSGRGVREILRCPLPAVLGVDKTEQGPGIPTYREKRRASGLPIRRLRTMEVPVEQRVVSKRVFPPRPRPKPVLPPDCTLDSHERIRQLLSGSRMKKSGVMLEGNGKEQVEGILSFLQERGFLEVGKRSEEV